jgi:hypothetical protein
MAAAAAGAHAEATEFDAGLAESYFIYGRAFGGGLAVQDPSRSQRQSAGGKGAFKKLAAAAIGIHCVLLPLRVGRTTDSRIRLMPDILIHQGHQSIPQSMEDAKSNFLQKQ